MSMPLSKLVVDFDLVEVGQHLHGLGFRYVARARDAATPTTITTSARVENGYLLIAASSCSNTLGSGSWAVVIASLQQAELTVMPISMRAD
jgi:hypothetical protein